MPITLADSEIDQILKAARALAQAEFKAGWVSKEGLYMKDLDLQVRRAQTRFAEIELMLGREPSEPLEF